MSRVRSLLWSALAVPVATIIEKRISKRNLEKTPDRERRTKLLQLLKRLSIHPVTEEITELARRYVRAGVFTPIMLNDAVHVAAAVLTRQDILVSWNFKHMVNRVRRAKVNEVNISVGLPSIEIIAPPEI